MNAFVDLFELLDLNVEIYKNSKLCGNWQVQERDLGATCFHLITQDKCFLSVPGVVETELNTGDLILFPRELPHTMRSLPSEERDKDMQLFGNDEVHVKMSDKRYGTGMLCGEFILRGQGTDSFIKALPPIIIIKDSLFAKDEVNWLKPLLTLFQQEAINAEASTNIILNKLSEILFIKSIQYFLNTNQEKVAFLNIYIHPQLSAAVNAFHEKPAKQWDLKSLAREAGLSRTQFSSKFKSYSGWTVYQYITWWRMQLAWAKLKRGESTSNVAYDIGYSSESAFIKVFTKEFGLTPSKARK